MYFCTLRATKKKQSNSLYVYTIKLIDQNKQNVVGHCAASSYLKDL